MSINQPFITALMPTCGRTVCIGESIYSFINQTYPYKKLIILDTHPQDIKFDIKLPGNISYLKESSFKFSNLGEKFKHLIKMVDTELFCIWEDDDIWLPNHLEILCKIYKPSENKTPYKIGNKDHFAMLGGVDKSISQLNISSNYCWCRYLYENKNIDIDSLPEPLDIHFLAKFNTIYSDDIPTYIYRWDNGQCHMSGAYGQKSYNELYRLFENSLSLVNVGSQTVNVAWRHDYTRLCLDLIK